jgi:hypothetical protein
MKIFDFREKSNFFERTACFPSLRPFTMDSKDFYNEIPITAERPFSCPVIEKFRAEFKVNYENKYIGKIVEPVNIHCFKGLFHEL